MSLELLLAIASGIIASLAAYVNLRKWIQERRLQALNIEAIEDRKLVEVIHSEVSKESVAIRGAQEAVTLMERMLDVAAQSEAKLQKKVEIQSDKIAHLEDENESLKRRVREHEKLVCEQDKIIQDLTSRLEVLEKKDANSV